MSIAEVLDDLLEDIEAEISRGSESRYPGGRISVPRADQYVTTTNHLVSEQKVSTRVPLKSFQF